MKYEIQKKEKSTIDILFSVEPKEVEVFMAQAAKNLSKGMNIPGFRPGNVPSAVIEQKLGKPVLWEEAARAGIALWYTRVVKENKLEPIGRPEVAITKLAPGNDFEFTLHVAVLPVFEIPPYTGLSAEKREVKISDEEVEKVINTLRDMRSKFHNVEREATKGDRAEVDLIVKIDGKVIPNGETKNMPVMIGGEERFIPGFEDQLIGMKKGETKEFTLSFPEKYYNKDLQGKEAQFTVTMQLVQEVEKPELNEEFAKSLGKFENFDEVRKQLRGNLEKEGEMKEKERYELALFDKVLEKVEIDIPDILLKGEVDKIMHEFRHDVESQGMTMDGYLSSVKTTEEELKKGWQKQAEKRIKAGLVLRRIAEKENIEIDDADIDAEVQKALAQTFDPEAQKTVQNPDYREYVREQLKNRKVFEKIVAEAK